MNLLNNPKFKTELFLGNASDAIEQLQIWLDENGSHVKASSVRAYTPDTKAARIDCLVSSRSLTIQSGDAIILNTEDETPFPSAMSVGSVFLLNRHDPEVMDKLMAEKANDLHDRLDVLNDTCFVQGGEGELEHCLEIANHLKELCDEKTNA